MNKLRGVYNSVLTGRGTRDIILHLNAQLAWITPRVLEN